MVGLFGEDYVAWELARHARQSCPLPFSSSFSPPLRYCLALHKHIFYMEANLCILNCMSYTDAFLHVANRRAHLCCLGIGQEDTVALPQQGQL